MTQVVLVRPWTDAAGGGGCCGGEPGHGLTLEGHLSAVKAPACEHPRQVMGQVYRRLRAERPEIDVQVVAAGNTLWLVPSVFRAARRQLGTAAAWRAALRANRAGAVLVDGIDIGDAHQLGADGVLRRLPVR